MFVSGYGHHGADDNGGGDDDDDKTQQVYLGHNIWTHVRTSTHTQFLFFSHSVGCTRARTHTPRPFFTARQYTENLVRTVVVDQCIFQCAARRTAESDSLAETFRALVIPLVGRCCANRPLSIKYLFLFILLARRKIVEILVVV